MFAEFGTMFLFSFCEECFMSRVSDFETIIDVSPMYVLLLFVVETLASRKMHHAKRNI